MKSIPMISGTLPNMAVAAGSTKEANPSPSTGFSEVLKRSIDAVNGASQEAQESALGLVSGQHANIHETMIALEKASISFKLMTKVQGKVVGAYEEIMRLQV